MNFLKNIKAKISRKIVAISIIIAVISTLYIALGLSGQNQGDIAWYQWMIHDWVSGKLPYIDHVVEYPPYALGIFFLPWLMGDSGYLINFMILAVGLDIIIKVILFVMGYKSENQKRAYLPLILYSVTVPFITYFYLQRFDLWPAMLSLVSIWLFWQKKYFWAGVVLSVGIGTKLYPILFFLPMVIFVFKENIENSFKPFIKGVIVGLLPILILSFFLPWWNFASFHTARGLQVESTYASFLWFAKHLGWSGGEGLIWIRSTAWFEVQGYSAIFWVSLAKFIFAGTVILSTIYSCAVIFFADKVNVKLSIINIVRILLIALLPFIAFNMVLSPQYVVWILPLAVLASLEGILWPIIAICIAVALTPEFYPVPNYFSVGLDFSETFALALRNLLLILAWLGFIFEFYKLVLAKIIRK